MLPPPSFLGCSMTIALDGTYGPNLIGFATVLHKPETLISRNDSHGVHTE